eukprot:1696935-Rhodomonas_salina.1
MESAEAMVGDVWDLSGCQSAVFKATILASIRRELTWPKLVTNTIPLLVGKELGLLLQATEYVSDGGNRVQIVLQGPQAEDGSSFARSFKLNLNDGTVHGTWIDLWDRGKEILDRNGTQLLNEMKLSRHVDWASFAAKLPVICENMKRVRKRVWCLYDEGAGVWREYGEDTTCAKTFLSDTMKDYFQPFIDYLDYKSTFDSMAEAQRNSMQKVSDAFANSDFLDKVLTMMEAQPSVVVGEYNKVFNANGNVLPCQNGLLDFRTLQLRELKREDFVTFRVPATWDPTASLDGPLEFIKSLFPNDQEDVVEFITTWLGYCLTGLTMQQILVFMIGYGSNGKSKLSKVMENILGEGFAHVTYEALCQKGSSPNEDVFSARNARMWQIDENDGDGSLNMAVIKRVSGEDSIRCRQLYGHIVEVPPRA